MSDDIKINVGVKSSVKSDLDRLVSEMNTSLSKVSSAPMSDLLSRGKVVDDSNRKDRTIAENEEILAALKNSASVQSREYAKTAEQLSKEFGIAGKRAGSEYSKSLNGSGIKGALTQLVRGDISGAIESLSDGLNIGMKSISAKALVWGGGIATALIAGWKAGQRLDEMLGISDKIATAWAGAANNIRDSMTRSMAAVRLEFAATEKADAELASKLEDVFSKRKAIGGGAQGNLQAETEKMIKLQQESEELGLSREESDKRAIALEEQINVVKAAGIAADEESLSLVEQKAKLKREDAEWSERIAKSEEAAGQKRFQEEVKKAEIAAMAKLDAAKKAKEGEKQKAEDVAKAQKAKDDERIAKLRDMAKMIEVGNAKIDIAKDPDAFRNDQNQKKIAKRDEDREKRLIAQAKADQARGVKLSPRMLALLAGDADVNAGMKANAAANALELEAKKAQIAAAANIERMQKDIAALAAQINGVVKP
jgi:hypothetical protein